MLESRQEFLKPIKYGDEFTVRLRANELKAASVRIIYEILLAKGNSLAHRAWMRMVYVEKSDDGFRMRKMPDQLRAVFAPLDSSLD